LSHRVPTFPLFASWRNRFLRTPATGQLHPLGLRIAETKCSSRQESIF
jgi:hypothetical protein